MLSAILIVPNLASQRIDLPSGPTGQRITLQHLLRLGSDSPIMAPRSYWPRVLVTPSSCAAPL
jgi:hypothetical protein